MRRSGSSSCLLRPKRSYEDFLGQGGEESKQQVEQPSANVTLSVTLLSTEQLPSYSAERFFMLSELEIKAHSLQFLCDFDEPDEAATTDTDTHTTETEELSMEAAGDENTSSPTIPRSQPDLPEYMLLYFLWRPSCSAQVFVDTTIVEAVERLQTMGVDLAPSSTKSAGQETPSSPTSVTTRQEFSSDSDDSRKKPTSVYLVVDRVAPSEESSTSSSHPVQQNLAQELARLVASHPLLRSVCQGVTVGVSNHVRAAPGLEACVDAVSLGAKDRRLVEKDKDGSKSLLGVIALRPDECVGLQSQLVTDAAQGVLQNRICAEWNGLGNLQTFARRANAAWRVQHGLLPETFTEPVRRRVPRIPKPPPEECYAELPELEDVATDEEIQERLVSAFVGVLIGSWVTFHFMEELQVIAWLLFIGSEMLAEKLREL